MSKNGSKYAMPIIVLCLGGEMLYILNQRLQAQNIADQKSKQVLQDVVKAMFSPQFLLELFKPQEIYSVLSTKQVFEKLAHSSIMRLNQSSMDKLYDLMTMGFKYQILQCNCPQQYLHVLLVHLESIKQLLGQSAVSDLAQTAIDTAIQVYSGFSMSNWVQLKISLLKFIQGKKIKVSLFLQHKMQNLDGSLVLNNKEKIPKGSEVPGTITFFESGNALSKLCFRPIIKDLSISSAIIDAYSTIGINMYARSYKPELENENPNLSSLRAINAMELSSSMPKTLSSTTDTPLKNAKLELNFLADMLGIGDVSSDKSSHVPLHINLFPDFAADNKSISNTLDYESFIMVDIDGSADSKSVSQYLEKLNFSDGEKISLDSKLEDDLLSLMDKAK